MAARGRRNKPRVVWLPPNDSFNVGVDQTNGVHEFTVDTTGDAGAETVAEIPLTIDGQFDASDPQTSLADMFDSGYRLRRIVGKFWCTMVQGGAGAHVVLVTAGIIVRRESTIDGQSLASQVDTPTQISPVNVDNYTDPWIWRRSWVLSDEANQVASNTKGPRGNYFDGYAGGNADGPHVDQKTARIIGPEERLFLNVSSMVLIAGGGIQDASIVRCWADFRLLASLRTTTGNRRNASR